MKNIVYNYLEVEIKVWEVMSNDFWGLFSFFMLEIVDFIYNVVVFLEIMSMIWKWFNDYGKNWWYVYKVMMLMEYFIKIGLECVL